MSRAYQATQSTSTPLADAVEEDAWDWPVDLTQYERSPLTLTPDEAAAWLSGFGVESEAEILEQSARSVLAACHLLGRPFRPQLPPGRWGTAKDR